MLLRNVVKQEDVDDPISVSAFPPCSLARAAPANAFINTPPPQTEVEQILARTRAEKLTKIYNLPAFSTALEFLTMFALSTGRLLRVQSPSPSFPHFPPD